MLKNIRNIAMFKFTKVEQRKLPNIAFRAFFMP